MLLVFLCGSSNFNLRRSCRITEYALYLFMDNIVESVARDLGADEPTIRLIVSLFAGKVLVGWVSSRRHVRVIFTPLTPLFM